MNLLETQPFEKKSHLSSSSEKDIFGNFFSRIIHYNKHQRTTYKGAHGFLTVIVQMIR